MVGSFPDGNSALMLVAARLRHISGTKWGTNLHCSYVGRILRMVNLAPDIQEAIIKGDDAKCLTMRTLKNSIPDNWEEQRRLFGMTH